MKHDRNLVEGSGVFNPKVEILSLDFIYLLPFSKYICKNCVDLLKKRRRLKDELAKVNEKLKLKYNKKAAATDTVIGFDEDEALPISERPSKIRRVLLS